MQKPIHRKRVTFGQRLKCLKLKLPNMRAKESKQRMENSMETPPRMRTDTDYKTYVPVHVVWEITLACDLKCMHCGSRAGHRRTDELSTAECLETVEALARLGTREISLIGGEAYLRKDFTEIIRAIRKRGIYCAIQTVGRQFTPARLQAAIEAGIGGLGVS